MLPMQGSGILSAARDTQQGLPDVIQNKAYTKCPPDSWHDLPYPPSMNLSLEGKNLRTPQLCGFFAGSCSSECLQYIEISLIRSDSFLTKFKRSSFLAAANLGSERQSGPILKRLVNSLEPLPYGEHVLRRLHCVVPRESM